MAELDDDTRAWVEEHAGGTISSAQQIPAGGRIGYAILTLGTGFESPPYWIYHSFGFRSIDGTSGRMKWLATPDAETSWFRAGDATARPLRRRGGCGAGRRRGRPPCRTRGSHGRARRPGRR